MRKLVAAAFVSLDGVIQSPGMPTEDPTGDFRFGGWLWPHSDDVNGGWVSELFATPFDLLLGRKTYEIFAAYWPFMPQDNPTAAPFNRVTKYVATQTGAPMTWANSVALTDAAADVARLKQQDGPTLLTQGSGDLLQTLMAEGLIDEFRLMTYPVILGRGKRLFGERAAPTTLKLTRTATSPKGAVLSVYEPAGAVETGSFGTLEPNPLEIARQERMKREG
ncbi:MULTISPECIES: dihydrofolate reductase family protein [unclassified Phenylobacterium]|uniref:dihydrofolate reductase family protein n=1 Tax=unclassified Phenylobacterium TaxID=2640670 RepID=UPI00083B89E5|nr:MULTISPECIES: dihydrofolate reductase family protein [unclassified Phenylobacterium]